VVGALFAIDLLAMPRYGILDILLSVDFDANIVAIGDALVNLHNANHSIFQLASLLVHLKFDDTRVYSRLDQSAFDVRFFVFFVFVFVQASARSLSMS
jgi:hypothetical protein